MSALTTACGNLKSKGENAMNTQPEAIIKECKKRLHFEGMAAKIIVMRSYKSVIKAKDATVLFGVNGRKVAEIKGATYTVAASDMAYLIDQCAIECTGCTKSGREVKQCQMRRIMLRSGVLPSGEKECPFSTGI